MSKANCFKKLFLNRLQWQGNKCNIGYVCVWMHYPIFLDAVADEKVNTFNENIIRFWLVVGACNHCVTLRTGKWRISSVSYWSVLSTLGDKAHLWDGLIFFKYLEEVVYNFSVRAKQFLFHHRFENIHGGNYGWNICRGAFKFKVS